MYERRRFNGFKLRMAVFMAVVSLFHQKTNFCFSLNSEGLALSKFRDGVVRDPFGALLNWNENDGVIDPCSWFGVKCSDGKVIILNLKDLCLDGTLAPELGNLVHVKFIILRNNSFSGNIPSEIGEMRELEVLDLGYNNFSGPFPSYIGDSLSLTTLFLDNNKFLGSISPELYQLKTLSEFQIDENQLTNSISIIRKPGEVAYRRQLQVVEVENHLRTRNIDNRKGSDISPSPSVSSSPSHPPFSPLRSLSVPSPASTTNIYLIPSPAPSPSSVEAPTAASPAPANPHVVSILPHFHGVPMPSPSPATPIQTGEKHSNSKLIISAGVVGGFLLILTSAVGLFFIRRSKVVTVKPWVTGLSGQLQKALVTGVPKLKRSELEAACEDFSNIIGSLSDGIVYKGTLSSGVEIAVTSTAVTSTKEWSKTLEARFRKKIKTLSKVNHKNFVNLIGYCEEEEPFTRMMVFEYAPNGTLFEHLHIKEAEHLDWEMRLRIAMGMAYCLEHMHQLTPPIAHENLQSSSVYLTEDYAAKISDFSFCNDLTAAKIGSSNIELYQIPSADSGENVYNFGVILFEMITGRIPYSVYDGSFSDWASDYLSRKQPLIEMVDPTLKSFETEKIEKLQEVIKSCVHPDLNQRPVMKEIIVRMKEITTMGPDGATPRLSPLWWAELEIMSTEGS